MASPLPPRLRQTCHVSPVFSRFTPILASYVKVFEFLLAIPGGILAVVGVGMNIATNKQTNTNMKTADQREITPSVASPQHLNTVATIASPAPQREQATDKNAIRPFRVKVSEAELTELRNRINSTKWPDRETVTDATQGVQLATVQALARYWATEYDWRKIEAKSNALPHFVTDVSTR